MADPSWKVCGIPPTQGEFRAADPANSQGQAPQRSRLKPNAKARPQKGDRACKFFNRALVVVLKKRGGRSPIRSAGPLCDEAA
jgi:hypothetical protein